MRVVRPSLLASLALALLAPSAARGDVVCVRPGGGTIAGCDLVRPTIAGGIDDAFPGDVIRVAAGTYLEHVEITANVTLEGGWNAGFTARSPAVNVTTIQAAEIDRSVVTIRGTAGQSGASTPILDGFTITGGNSHTAHGGGIALFDSNATIRNCVVTANEGYLFGGGIYVRGGAPRLEGNRIEGNAVNTAGLGGGIALEAARAVLVDNVVADNRILDGAGHGGGVAASGGGPIAIRGGRIEGNESGPSCTGDSGGLYATGVTHIDVDGVRFEGNCAGSTWAVGAALFDGSPFTLSNCLVVQQGGANSAVLSVDDVSPGAVRNCTFVGGGGGSGLVVLSEAELTNDIFTGFATAVATDYDIDPPISSHNLFWNNTANTDANWSLGPTDQVADPRLDSTHHLTAASPAVDAGVRPPAPTYDVDGDPRVADGGSGRFRVDIGADERAGRGQRNLDLALASADLEIIGPGNPPENPGSSGSNDWIGRAVLGADVSGDGKDDLVVAAQDFADDFDTLNAGGRLFGLLHFGTRRTGTIDLAVEPADFEVTCQIPLQHLGEELVAGDLDDDGVLDLVIGASDSHGDPAVRPGAFVLFGGAGLATNGATIAPGALADFAVRPVETSSLVFAGVNALAAGDLSGDGIDDLVVGDSSADAAQDDDGAVYVFFGDPLLSGVHDLATTPADVTFQGSNGDASFGSGPYAGGLAIGDLDDDGQPDLVIRENEFAHVLYGPLSAGTHAIAAGTQDLPTGDTEIHALQPGGVLVMDMTGDGVDDLLLDSAGSLLVFAGPRPRNQILGTSAAAYALAHDDVFAAQVLASADLVGNARPDLLVGKPDDGTALVVPPGAYGPGTVPIGEVASWNVFSSTPDAARNVGWDVAGGDLDGDGRDDLLIGAWQTADPTRDLEFQDVGKAFVLYGAVPEPSAGQAGVAAALTIARLARRRRLTRRGTRPCASRGTP